MLFALFASLFSCSKEKANKLDGDGMVYVDSDYRTKFANTLDFDSAEVDAYWAVAFLGYGEDGENNRQVYIESLFSSLPEEDVKSIGHYDFEGDEWYLIVPRHKDMNTVTPLYDNAQTVLVENGCAFTVKCNISDLYSNISIGIDSHGGVEFSPRIDGKGSLDCGENVIDITNYGDIGK